MLKTKETIEWLKKSEDDLAIAKAIIKEKAPYWAACFHAQQAAEKVLKTAQIYFLRDFQKEHDLLVLLDSLKGKLEIETIYQECLRLSGFYVTTRYPDIKESELTRKDALSAIKDARKILDLIKSKLD